MSVRQTSASARAGRLRRILPLTAPAMALVVLFAGPPSHAPASPDPQSFTPAFGLGVSSTATSANAAVTLTTTVPAGNHRLGQTFYLVPKLWGVAGDSAIQNGDMVGTVSLAADLNCDGTVEPPLIADLTEVNDPDTHAHWNATLGPPLNLTLQYLVDVNVDDPDVDYDIAVAVFPSNPASPCNPMTFLTTINGLSGLGTPLLTNPNPARTYIWQALYVSAPVSQLEHIVARYARVCIGGPDGDSDGVCNAQDNCPSAINPDQGDANTDGIGDACDPGDFDLDGYSDRVEYFAGTDRSAACPTNAAHNAWPADLNNDGFSDISDLGDVAASFGQSVPPAPARRNIAPDPLDAFVDISDMGSVASWFGRTCLPDLDGDGVPDISDNCLAAPNADQLNINPADGLGDACDPDDFDLDGFSDRVEYFAGTDRGAPCATGPSHDAWPADINNDRFSDITDIAAVAADFGRAAPPAPARHNIAPDPPDGFVDVTDIGGIATYFGEGC